MTDVEFYRREVVVMDQFIEAWGSIMEPYLSNSADLRQCVEGYVKARLSREEALIRLEYLEGGDSDA